MLALAATWCVASNPAVILVQATVMPAISRFFQLFDILRASVTLGRIYIVHLFWFLSTTDWRIPYCMCCCQLWFDHKYTVVERQSTTVFVCSRAGNRCERTWAEQHPGSQDIQPYWKWEPSNCILKALTKPRFCRVMDRRKGILLVGAC